ncbi:hypothetical protein SCHPADRAFT_1003393 [Schizopora paradoxa]|uniref:DUF6533 domain-containing protein n=1 Tax=Schizopora paradoxa TaxID=27342 RepID=A0A0H2RGT3_9AGAM|nr:hypothetical protein SCHPADRAFT_1003393 [Schizopora paradoxa]
MDALVTAGRHVLIMRYTAVATSMLIFYEYMITFHNEIRYLWKRRSTFAGTLLGLGRYVPMLTSSHSIYLYTSAKDISSCYPGYVVFASLCYVEFLVPLFVLFFRAYAVWGGAKPAFTFLVGLYVCFVASTIYLVYTYVRGVSVPELRVSRGCLYQFANDDIWYALLVLVFCEFLALGLIVIKLLQHMAYLKNRPRALKQDLLTVVAHDGVGYFACSLGMSFARSPEDPLTFGSVITTINLIALKHLTVLLHLSLFYHGSSDSYRSQPDLRDFLIGTQGALQNILCNRLLFHVYSLHEARSI